MEKQPNATLRQHRANDVENAGNGLQIRDGSLRPSQPSTPPAIDNDQLQENGLSIEDVISEADEFVQGKRLQKYARLFKTAAVVSYFGYEHFNDPVDTGEFDYTNLRPLEEEELEYLRAEDTNMWDHPRELYWTIALCSVGAAVQGWDQTGTNGANIFYPTALGIPQPSSTDPPNGNSWIVGLINAAPYLAASLLGCWLSDPLNRWLGRRGAIFLAAIFCFVPVLGSAFVATWPQLLICRLLLGLGMGVKATTVPVFAAENAPAKIRGALVMSWQMWVAFGIFLGVTFNLAVWSTGAIVWRLQLGFAALPAIPLLMGIFLCPESPRWCIKANNYPKAFRSLRRTRNTDLQAARDLFFIHADLKEELADMETAQLTQKGGGYSARLIELFTETKENRLSGTKRNRPAAVAAFTVMIAQQMCGINIIAFYSSTVFLDAGASPEGALWGSWGFGLINFLFAIPALFTIDTKGRRTLLLFTFPNMAWTLLAAGFCEKIANNTTKVAMVAVFVFIFAIFYSVGEGPVPFTYSAEVFPLSHREVGMGFSVATNLFWAAILGLTFPSMLHAMGPTGAFGFYAALNVVAFIMIFLFMPETRQKTLEKLDDTFEVSAMDFARWQIKENIPHIIRRIMHRGSPDVRKQLYKDDPVDFRRQSL